MDPIMTPVIGAPEDLIRILSYPRKEHELAVLHYEDNPPLADIRSHTSDLGTLGQLPLELLIEILRHHHLRSLLQYRKVNSRAWGSVNSIPEYRLTATHTVNVLRAICGLGVARHFSILQVFNALVSQKCDMCRDSGAFLLFLPTCSRCCIRCAMLEKGLHVVGELNEQDVFHFDTPILEVEVPVLHTYPGVYTTDQKAYAARHYVVSWSAVIRVRKRMSPILFRRQGALATSPWSPIPSVASEVEERFNMLTLLKPSLDWRCMVITPMPQLDRLSSRIDMGLSCKGCQEFMKDMPPRARKFKRKYTGEDRIFCQREFLEHVTTCIDAQRLWNLSQEGTRTSASGGLHG